MMAYWWYIFITEEAIDKHGSENIKIYKTEFLPMYYQMVSHKSRMKMKLVLYYNLFLWVM